MARLQEFYRATVVPRLREDLKIENAMQVPRITKITVNMGVGEAVADRKVMDAAVTDLTKISGQKPLITKSRKAIASFKLRAGLAVGAKVTLRGARMYEFLDRLINIAMPRIRDFRGVSARSFDGQGNYSLGVKEQIIFPEIQYDQVDQIRGMDITITTTAVDIPGRAGCRTGEVAIDAPRREPIAPEESLRDHRPFARRVSQIRVVPREDPRSRLPGRDSGSHEGELVRGAL